MSRRSTRGNKRKQQTEYLEDVTKFGKRRKVEEQAHLTDVTNEVNSPLSHLSMTPASEEVCRHLSECSCPAFYLPRSLSLSGLRERNPLPDLFWANSDDVWRVMLDKESKPSFRRDPKMFEKHSGLEERMRAILFDWLIEVCEVYKMHRETFYMCADYVDRYLSKMTDVKKSQLQLIGITALFIAAKMEEIYPARLSEFSYVTDGACTEEEILEQEIIMLKVLGWDLSPLTSHMWLTTFYQTACCRSLRKSSSIGRMFESTETAHRSSTEHEDNENQSVECCADTDKDCCCPCCYLHTRQFSQHSFLQLIRLLDLCILHSGWLEFSYSVLATSVLHYQLSPEKALEVSGMQWGDISECVAWMLPFVRVLDHQEEVELKKFSRVVDADAHNIQTHTVNLQLLSLADEWRRNHPVERDSRAFTPEIISTHVVAMTPPVIVGTPLVMTPPNSQKSKSKSIISEESN